MATINLLNNGSNKTSRDMGKVISYVQKEAKTSHEGKKLVTGINCPAETAFTNMMLTKNYFHKTDGRMYYHLCQSFSPDEKITPETAHKIAVEFAEKQFPGYEIVVGTHVDREHIHSHILFNSVSFKDGKKYHSDKHDILRWRDTSDEICMKYGLSVIKKPQKEQTQKIRSREYRSAVKGQSWKINLVVQIEDTMKKAKTKKDFRRIMEEKGYQITWTDTRKNITYTTPEGKKCRDDRLHENKFLKEMMEHEFRIRAELIGSQESSTEQSGVGIQADSVRCDNGTELEGTSDIVVFPTSNDGKNGNERSDEFLPRTASDDIQQRSILAGEAGAALFRSVEGQDRGTDQGIGETGWEAERAICFGYGEVSEGFADADGWSDEAADSGIYQADTAFDIGLSSLRLAADIGDLMESDPASVPDTTSIPAGVDRKLWEEIAEKKQALGIRMGGM